jgi:hypothetical protein
MVQDRKDHQLRSGTDPVGVGNCESWRSLTKVEKCFRNIELRTGRNEAEMPIHHLSADGGRRMVEQQKDEIDAKLATNQVTVLEKFRSRSLSRLANGHEDQRASIERSLPQGVAVAHEMREIGGRHWHKIEPLPKRVVDIRFRSFGERFQPRGRDAI